MPRSRTSTRKAAAGRWHAAPVARKCGGRQAPSRQKRRLAERVQASYHECMQQTQPSSAGFKRQVVFRLDAEQWTLLERAAAEYDRSNQLSSPPSTHCRRRHSTARVRMKQHVPSPPRSQSRRRQSRSHKRTSRTHRPKPPMIRSADCSRGGRHPRRQSRNRPRLHPRWPTPRPLRRNAWQGAAGSPTGQPSPPTSGASKASADINRALFPHCDCEATISSSPASALATEIAVAAY
jgi:hypothetical protein